jgi:hypothetical protein
MRRSNVSTLVTGVFGSRLSAQQASEDLMKAGFSPDDISVLMSETTQGREFGIQKGTKAPEAAAAGATIGGVLGAIAGGLVAVGSLTVPGLALVAAGPIVGALTGLGVGTATGGVTGALVGLGIPEHEAKFYDQEVEEGGILLGVYAHADRVKLARDVLDSAGAERVK